jgi:hypothetical protein
MSKIYLRIRPNYHRLRHRIEAQICLSFVAYSKYKKSTRLLLKEKFELSIEKVTDNTHNTYQMEITFPKSRYNKNVLLKTDVN